jgi:hypothetical protein
LLFDLLNLGPHNLKGISLTVLDINSKFNCSFRHLIAPFSPELRRKLRWICAGKRRKLRRSHLNFGAICAGFVPVNGAICAGKTTQFAPELRRIGLRFGANCAEIAPFNGANSAQIRRKNATSVPGYHHP